MCRATLFYSAAFYRAARRLGAASHRRYVLAFGMLVVLAAIPLTSGTAAAGAGPARSARYLGRTFTIPRGWRVIDLTAHPHQCVRFDRHVLYLGAPGRVQDCPAGLVGATEAMLLQPSARRAVPRAVDYPVDRMITVVTRRITVTASYSSDRAQIGRMLASAALPMPARGSDGGATPRIHQYQGGRNVSYGGDTINIDQDYLDVQRQALAGGSAQASPAVAQPTGAVSAFFRGVGGQLWRDSFTPGAGWQHPASMGGSLATRPSAVTSVPGTVAVFAKGTDGRLWAAVSQPGHGWPALRPLHMGRLGSRPAAVAQADGVIDVFWRGSADHHLWQAQYNRGHGWGKAHDLGGQLGSAPAPAASGRGTLTVFWQGRDGHLWVIRRQPGHSWSRPASLGMGRLGGAPAATGLASGEVDVFWPAKSHASVWQLSYLPGHGWGTAHNLPAGVSAGPVAVAAPATGVDVFWKGSNGTLWWTAGHGASWAQPASAGMGVLGSAPFAAGQPGGVANVFWKGSADGHLWQARYRRGAWSGPADLGGAVPWGCGGRCTRLMLRDY